MNRNFVAAHSLALLLGFAAVPAATANGPIVIAQASPTTEGEVRRIDKDAGKVTLQHGPIPNLEMGAMTMVFRVSDPAMLDRLKTGDKVRFSAEKISGQYTVTNVEVMQ